MVKQMYVQKVLLTEPKNRSMMENPCPPLNLSFFLLVGPTIPILHKVQFGNMSRRLLAQCPACSASTAAESAQKALNPPEANNIRSSRIKGQTSKKPLKVNFGEIKKNSGRGNS